MTFLILFSIHEIVSQNIWNNELVGILIKESEQLHSGCMTSPIELSHSSDALPRLAETVCSHAYPGKTSQRDIHWTSAWVWEKTMKSIEITSVFQLACIESTDRILPLLTATSKDQKRFKYALWRWHALGFAASPVSNSELVNVLNGRIKLH